ncbi:hypothetical protein IAF28_19690, partial [Acinetobacter baumannii]|nr:hypothetical protein [Acinetobacter baumannii]
QHADFYLPKIGFSFIRQYNSQMDEFDQSMVGARWMMPFSNMILANIFALTGSVLDLMLFATDKKTGDAAVQRGALLAANLIGLFS